MIFGFVFFDINIFIDLFSGCCEVKQVLEVWLLQNVISLIIWMEVMVGVKKYYQEQCM